MTEPQFQILRRAVNVSRDQNVKRIATLRRILVEEGYEEGDIEAALTYWANYHKAKHHDH